MSARPWPITAVGILGGAAALVTIVLFTTSAPWAVQPTVPQRVVGLAAVAVVLTALAGMWRMRRWSVVLVAILLALRLGYGIVRPGDWSVTALALPVLLLVLGAVYWRRMA
ncbi:MAG TPA: hypothetical protein VMT77_06570 [Gemmatimonadales bacterium]|nr:hypothetical protein [Gemmatimonadales bacterium]